MKNQGDLKSLKRVTTVNALQEAISKEILEKSFKPGEQLREAELAALYNVSRHSVREAFAILVHQGMLKKESHRGVFVPILTKDDVIDLYKCREVFELTAIEELAKGRKVTDELTRALLSYEDLSSKNLWSETVIADSRFHKSLVDGMGSPRVSSFYDVLLIEFRLCTSQFRLESSSLNLLKKVHRDLYETIVTGDWEKAVSHMKAHLEESLRLHLRVAEASQEEECVGSETFE